MRKTFTNQSGFTLVELMVVVAVVGVLLMAAVPLFTTSIEQSRVATCDSNIKNVKIAIARAAAIDGKSLSTIGNSDINPFISDGIGSLVCEAANNPQPTYTVVGGVITPSHNHR